MRVFSDDDLRAEMGKPINWRDRLYLASDALTADLGALDTGEAAEALAYIESLEAALRESGSTRSRPTNDTATDCQ